MGRVGQEYDLPAMFGQELLAGAIDGILRPVVDSKERPLTQEEQAIWERVQQAREAYKRVQEELKEEQRQEQRKR